MKKLIIFKKRETFLLLIIKQQIYNKKLSITKETIKTILLLKTKE